MNNPKRILISLTASIVGSVWFCMTAWAWAANYARNSCSESLTSFGLCKLARYINLMILSGLVLVPLLLVIGVLSVLAYRSLASNPYAKPFYVTLGSIFLVMNGLIGVFIFVEFAMSWSAPSAVKIAEQFFALALNLGAVIAAALLWRMQESGRQFTVAILLVSTAVFLWHWVSGPGWWSQLPPGTLLFVLFVPGLKIALLLYLLTPKTRTFFISGANKSEHISQSIA